MAHSKISAGILLFRRKEGAIEFFLVHPGGPFWKGKEEGAWSVPKGEVGEGSVGGGDGGSVSVGGSGSEGGGSREMLAHAKREFEEETSFSIEQCASGEFIALKPVKLKSGKIVYAWAVEGNIPADKIVSNTCVVEWPPRSGKQLEIPEVDKGAWFDAESAKRKINPGQVPLIDEVLQFRC